MSQGNLGAAIGLANTNKIPGIGNYVQGGTPPPGWEAWDSYVGCNGFGYWNRNVIDEDVAAVGGLTVRGDSGITIGKLARWVTNTASLTVSADQTIAVSATGVATAGTAAAYRTSLPVGLVIPANSFFWVFEV